jgi:Tfp pilus assembly protein PilN
MRPVNLIPPEDRRGDQAPLRSGPLAYVVVAALVLVLVGVAALVLTGNQVAEREDELASLRREDAAAAAKAERLSAYVQFRNASEARVATVRSLADSRFDWERVMRELALVLPSDVSLVELTASAGGASGGEAEGGSSGLGGGLSGPSLTMSGCAIGHEGVAGFVLALRDIDGVTRVGVQSSQDSDAGGESGGAAGGSECGVAAAHTEFTLTVAFDAAPVPPEAGAEPAPETESAPEAAQAATAASEEGPAGGEAEAEAEGG